MNQKMTQRDGNQPGVLVSKCGQMVQNRVLSFPQPRVSAPDLLMDQSPALYSRQLQSLNFSSVCHFSLLGPCSLLLSAIPSFSSGPSTMSLHWLDWTQVFRYKSIPSAAGPLYMPFSLLNFLSVQLTTLQMPAPNVILREAFPSFSDSFQHLCWQPHHTKSPSFIVPVRFH